MLRGAFGHALRKLTLLPHKNNEPCALKDTCPYCQIFATPPLPNHRLQKFSQMPAAYVIEPPTGGQQALAAGDLFPFDLVLIGRAIHQLPLVVFAFKQALENGLGKSKTSCTLVQVQQAEAGTILWQKGQAQMAASAPLPHVPETPHGSATLSFVTPLRLQQQGKLVGMRELDARTLLIALARRWQLLADVHLGGDAPQLDFTQLGDAARSINLHAQSMTWFDWQRYSNRQQQAMTLGGLIGNLTLHGDLSLFNSLLHIGQWLHIGKETVFGLGKYDLKWQ
ncbi:MAG: CRISPR system precrRNA processing endoribonuclease RAMP protein Cas6 [Alcanivoracaceae bacterium]